VLGCLNFLSDYVGRVGEGALVVHSEACFNVGWLDFGAILCIENKAKDLLPPLDEVWSRGLSENGAYQNQ